MGAFIAAIIGLICTVWLVFFTDLTTLQLGLIFALTLSALISDVLK